MPRLIMQCAEGLPAIPFPTQPGLSHSGQVDSQGIITDADRPIHLWMHDLRPGTRLEFDRPQVGHALYVLQGALQVNGKDVATDDAALIEHRGKATVQAGSSGAKVAHFHEQPTPSASPPRGGGHVHLCDHAGYYTVKSASGPGGRVQWADSSCPSCQLWLHRTDYVSARTQAHAHYHTEPEIIFFLRGEMLVGNRPLKPLTALAIDANTHYKFDTGAAGLSFLNFRCTEPHFVQKQPDGSYLSYNEREFAKNAGMAKATRLPPRGPAA